MFSKRTTAALFAIALASSLIIASGFTGFAFAAKKGKGNSVTNTMTNSDDSGGESNNSPTAPSDSQTPNRDDPTGSIDNTNNPQSEKLLSFLKCLNGNGSGPSLNLAKIKSCYGQLTSGGVGQGTEDQSSPSQGIGLPNVG